MTLERPTVITEVTGALESVPGCGIDTDPAQFLRDNGWGRGDVLRGEPILGGGNHLTAGRLVRISVVGKDYVIGQTLLDGSETWGEDTFCGFRDRSWALYGWTGR